MGFNWYLPISKNLSNLFLNRKQFPGFSPKILTNATFGFCSSYSQYIRMRLCRISSML